MIKISSFSAVDNFTRRTWEFDDDNIVIKTKSLILDYETNIEYEKIKAIQSKRMADLGWLWASFITVGLLALARMFLGFFYITNPIIDIIEEVVAVLALALIIPAFRNHEYYSFLDEDRNFLPTVRIDNKNKLSLLEAVNLVKQKAEITSETYFSDPLPSIPPVFQFTEFDFPDFLSKSNVRIYGDKIIDVEKSLAEKATTVISMMN